MSNYIGPDRSFSYVENYERFQNLRNLQLHDVESKVGLKNETHAQIPCYVYPYPSGSLHWHWTIPWIWLPQYQSCHLEEYDDVIKREHFPRYWSFVQGIHRSPVNSPHKGQWRAALMFCLICARINGWINNREAGDLRRHHTHFEVTNDMDKLI